MFSEERQTCLKIKKGTYLCTLDKLFRNLHEHDIGIVHTYKISVNTGYLSCKCKSSKLDLPQGWFSLYTQLFGESCCGGFGGED